MESELRDEIDRLRARITALEAEQQVSREIIENSPVMISVVRAPDFVYEVANPAFRMLAPGKEFLGRRFADVWAEGSDPLVEILQSVIRTGRTFQIENAPYAVQRGDDALPEVIYVTYSCIPITGGEGRPNRVLTLAKETTEAVLHRKTRELLEEKQALLQAVIISTPDAIYAKDRHGSYVIFNPAAERITGRTAADVLGQDDTGLRPAEASAVMEADRRIFESGTTVTLEEEVSTADRRKHVFLSTKGPLLDAKGLPLGIFCIARDITARKDAEEALRQSEQNHRRLFENTPQGVAYQRPDGQIISANPAAQRILGLSLDELRTGRLQNSDWKLVLEDGSELPADEHPFMVAIRTGKPVHDFILGVHNPQTSFDQWLSITEIPLFHSGETEPFQVFATFDDITGRRLAEHKKTEEAQRQGEALYRSLFENMLNGLAYCRMLFEHGKPHDFIYLEVNRAFEMQTGFKNVQGKKVTEVIPGIRKSDPHLFEIYGRVASTGRPESFEMFVEALDAWFSVSVYSPSRGDFVSVFDQITERKRVEKALRESEGMYRRLFDTMAQGVVYQEANGEIVHANPAAVRILGLTIDQMRGRTSMDPGWKAIRADGSELPGHEHPSMVALRTGKPVERYVMGVMNAQDKSRTWISITAVPLFEPGETSASHVYTTFEDVTAQRTAEENYQTLFREMREGFALHEILCDPGGHPVDYRFIAVNPAFEHMTGLKADDVVGRTVKEVLPALELHWIETYGKVALSGEPATFENYAAELGKYFQVTAFQTVTNHFACIFTDVTERKRVELALRESEIQYRTLANSGQALVWTSAPDKKCDYFNQPWLDFTGRPLERELGDGWVDGVHPEDLERCIEIYTGAFDRRERFSMEYRLRRHDGEFRWLQDDGMPRYDRIGRFLGYIGHCLDITERKCGEEALRESTRLLKAALAEKTVLLKEIHHRVKNNLAVTASLLSMKADECGPEARAALEESEQRVHTIALVHEHLYGTDCLDRIDLGEYVRDLVEGAYSTFGAEQKGIVLELQLDPVELGIDRAVPCALILNELLSNTFKHAFAGGRTGRILISLRQAESGHCELAVEDDGVGLPDGAFGVQSTSLGLRIVGILARQLKGSVEQENCSGARIVLRFPAFEPAR